MSIDSLLAALGTPKICTEWMNKPHETWTLGDEIREASFRVHSLSERFDRAPTSTIAIMLDWWERELARLEGGRRAGA